MRKRGGTKRQSKPTPKADAYKKELNEKSFLKVKKTQDKLDMDDLVGLMKKAIITNPVEHTGLGSGRRRRRITRRRY
jgi:hypothetical protein